MNHFDPEFWENVAYLLAGIVLAGVSAAIAQIVGLRMLTSGETHLRICMKKESKDADRKTEADHH